MEPTSPKNFEDGHLAFEEIWLRGDRKQQRILWKKECSEAIRVTQKGLMLRRAVLSLAILACAATAHGREMTRLRFFPQPGSQLGQAVTPLGIDEDGEGNLWIAAEQGLFRFDGSRFEKFGDFQVPQTVIVLGDGNLLVSDRNGVFLYQDGKKQLLVAEGSFSYALRLSDELVLLQHVPTNGVVAALARRGDQWTVRIEAGLNPFAKSTDGRIWTNCGNAPCSMDNTAAFRSAARDGSLAEYRDREARRAPAPKVPTIVDCVLPMAEGSFFVKESHASWIDVFPRNGSKLRLQAGTFTRSDWSPVPYADRSGRIWLPGDFLWLVKRTGLEKFGVPELLSRQVTCVFEDTRGRIWFGITGGGLAVMGMEPEMTSWAIPEAYGEINGLIRLDSQTLFAVAYKGQLFRKSGERAWEELQRGLGAPPIGQIVQGRDGKLLGTIRFGPPVAIDRNGKILREWPVEKGSSADAFKRMARSPAGEVFIGSQEQGELGLYRVDIQRLTVVRLPGNGGRVQEISFDREGRGFAGFQGGVCRIEGDRCELVLGLADGLLSPKIRGLCLRGRDEIWVVYRETEGFTRLTRANGKWAARQFTAKDGYDWPESSFIHSDRRGWIWRGSTGGLWVSDGQHLEPEDWIQITEREGLPSRVVSRFGYLEDEDGTVWIGTTLGIAHLYPKDDWFVRSGKARIGAVSYGGRWFEGAPHFPARFNELGAFGARIGARQMAPLSYRLLPREAGWRVNRTGEVQYGELKAGRYQFEAKNGAGQVARYEFEVRDMASERRMAGLALGGLTIWGAAAGLLAWRRAKRRKIEGRALPDLTELRVAALAPEAAKALDKPLGGRFVPRRLINEGDFASVFDGWDEQQGVRCAIKIFHNQLMEEGFARRFAQEVLALETVRHPNIVRIYGHGATVRGQPYLAMEFVEGCTLLKALEAGRMPPARVASFLRQTGSALGMLHSNGICHRDLKPENLMMRTAASEGEEVVLIDFSLAIVKTSDQTAHGLSRAAGTLRYMAPEQVMGYADAASDIYSLAKVTVELIAGKSVAELLPNAALDLPARLRALDGAMMTPLSRRGIEMLSTALEFDPLRRPKNAAEFASFLAGELAGT